MKLTTRLALFVATTMVSSAAFTAAAPSAHAAQFDPVPAAGCLQKLAVGPNDDAWGIGCTANGAGGNGVYHLEGSNQTWVQKPGAARDIAVSAAGTPWVLDRDGGVFKWNGNGFTQFPGCAISIGVGPANDPWVIGCDRNGAGHNIYHWTGSDYVQIQGGAEKIAVSPEGIPWVLNSDGNIYQWNGSAFVQHSGCAHTIGIGRNRNVWVTGCDTSPDGSSIFQLQGDTFVQVPGNAGDVAVSPEGTPFVVNNSGVVFEYSNVSDGSIVWTFDNITFASGVAAGGHAKVTMWPDGSYRFEGGFHDSGLWAYNDNIVVVVKAADGTAFTFSRGGSMAGTLEDGSRDDPWSTPGTNPAIAAHWGDLSVGSKGVQSSSVSLDFGSLFSSLKTDIGYIGQIVAVVGPLLA